MKRRSFVAAGMATAAAAATPDLGSARADFPWATKETYLNTATEHPLSVRTTAAMQEYLHALTHGPDSARDRYENGELMKEVRRMFARLINAKPEEIGFTPSTQTGENLVLEGLDIQTGGGNVVTNDLHYGGSLHNYENRRKAGMDVRVVRHRDYEIDMRDLERVVDRKTRLVAIALVSNVNGYLHDVKAISDLAHAHGAYLYCDVIQAAGALPIDVRAMGIDFLACSAYKFLMGGRFGYLYVREDLQGTTLRPKLFGGRSTATGASRYEISTVSHLGCVCQHQALQYIHALGVDRINGHARPLIDRLRKDLPAAGYPSITSRTSSSIASFRVKDPAATKARLRKANVIATAGDHLRISVSVFNNMADIERLLQALS